MCWIYNRSLIGVVYVERGAFYEIQKICGRRSGSCPLSVLHPSPDSGRKPEFAYTAEKWAALRDNKLEFEEIADLVHEYNNKVIQNQIEYEDYRGEDKDDIAQDYYDAADDIYGSLYYPGSGDENYAGSLSSYLSGQIQADNLREQGDDNVEDGDIKKLGYDKEEAELVKQAQGLMITYWSRNKSMASLEKTRDQAQTNYNSTVTRLSRHVHPGRPAVGSGERGFGGSFPSFRRKQLKQYKGKSLPHAGLDLRRRGGNRRGARPGSEFHPDH